MKSAWPYSLLDTARRLRHWLIQFTTAHNLGENTFLIALSAIIGVGGGLGAVFFRWLIRTFHHLFMDRGMGFLGHSYLLPLVPAAGGLLVGILVLRWAREARGHGVPEVMAAVATQEGRIRPRVALIKSVASALCIGSGGSVGREGPIVQIGSALGSSLGQFFGLGAQQMKVVVGCGAAAGISATFNAPLAGVLFALEVILRDFTLHTFSPILISSVLATALSRSMLGNAPAFIVPSYQTVSPYELFYYAVLGLLAGAVAVAFTRFLYRLEDIFEALPLSEYAKPVIGGLLVGCVGLLFPQVFGVGYDAITAILRNEGPLRLILLLFAAKFLATSLTLGSGGSGGIFAPSLFLGATFGSVFGYAINSLSPQITAQPGAYALVGMGAMVAGTTHAPMTAMLILFELTDDYKIILPLMLATTLSTLVARWIEPESIYTIKLIRRGLQLGQSRDRSILSSIRVREITSENCDLVKLHTPLGEIVGLLRRSEVTDFPVVSDSRVLRGVVSFQDIRAVMTENELYYLLIAADIMNDTPPTVRADASLLEALALFAESNIRHLPVVEDDENQQLLGIITHAGLMNRYSQELHRRAGRESS